LFAVVAAVDTMKTEDDEKINPKVEQEQQKEENDEGN